MQNDIMEKLLKEAVEPTKTADTLLTLRDLILQDNDTLEKNNATISQLTNDVNSLRDTNMRLFSRITTDVKEPEEEEHIETIDELNDRISNMLLGTEKGND